MLRTSTFELRAFVGPFLINLAFCMLFVFCSSACQLRLPSMPNGIWNVSKQDKVAPNDAAGEKIDTETQTDPAPPAAVDAGEFDMFYSMRPVLLEIGGVLMNCSMIPPALFLAYVLAWTAALPRVIIDNNVAVVPVVVLLLLCTIRDFTSTITWYVDLVMVEMNGTNILAGVQRETTSNANLGWPRLCFSYTIAILASLIIVAHYESGSFEQRQQFQVLWNRETVASGIWRNNISKKVDFVMAIVMDAGTVILPKLPFVVGTWSEIYKPACANCPSFENDVFLACWAFFMLCKVTLQKADVIMLCEKLICAPQENLREDQFGRRYDSSNMRVLKMLAQRAERVKRCYRWLDHINKFLAWVLFSAFHLYLHSKHISPLVALRCTYSNSACTALDSTCTSAQKYWAVHDCVASVLCYIFCVALSNVLCRMYIFNIPTEPVFDGRLHTDFNENRVVNPDRSFNGALFMNFVLFVNTFGHMPGQSGDDSNHHVVLVKKNDQGETLYGETSRKPMPTQRAQQHNMMTHTQGQGMHNFAIQSCHPPHDVSDSRPIRQKSQRDSPRQHVDDNRPDPRLQSVTEQYESIVTIEEDKTVYVQWIFAGTALVGLFSNLNLFRPTLIHHIEFWWALASGFFTFKIEVDHRCTTRLQWDPYHVYMDWRAYNIFFSRWLGSAFYMYPNGDLVSGEVVEDNNGNHTDKHGRPVIEFQAPESTAGGKFPRMCIPIHPSRRISYGGVVFLVLALALFSHACYHHAHQDVVRPRNKEDAWRRTHKDVADVCALDPDSWRIHPIDDKPLLNKLCIVAYTTDYRPFMEAYSQNAEDFFSCCDKYCSPDNSDPLAEMLKREERFCGSNMKGVCFRLSMLKEVMNNGQRHQAFVDYHEQRNIQNLIWITCITAVLYLARVVFQNDCLQHLPLTFAATTVAGYMLKDFLTEEPKRHYDLMIPCLGTMLAIQFLHFKTAAINIAALNWGTVHVIFWIIMHVLPTGANMWLNVARFWDINPEKYGIILLFRTALQHAVLMHLSRHATHIMLVEYESFESSRAQLLGVAVCAVFLTVAEMVSYAHNREAVSTHQFQSIIMTAAVHALLFFLVRIMLLNTGPENIWGTITREKHVLDLNEHIKNVVAGIQNMITGMANTSLANKALEKCVKKSEFGKYGIATLQGIVNAQLLCRMTRNDNCPITTIINSAKILLYRLEVPIIADFCQTIYTWWLTACLIGAFYIETPADSFGADPFWQFSSINQWANGSKHEITGVKNSPLLFVCMRMIYISAEITLNLWNMISI